MHRQVCIIASLCILINVAAFTTSRVRRGKQSGIISIATQATHSKNDFNQVLQYIHPLTKLQNHSFQEITNLLPKSVEVVLIGEGTHGTQEFFDIRSDITRCLIEHHNFDAVVCEGDVFPFIELNRYVTYDAVKTKSRDEVRGLLSELFSNHFPYWMWSNMPMAEFVIWLNEFNSNHNARTPVQLIGMDIQDPFGSMDFIFHQLNAMGEYSLATFINEQYAPLNKFRPNARSYGDAIFGNRIPSQEIAVNRVLNEILVRYNSLVNYRECNQTADDVAQIWHQLLEVARAIAASECYHRQRIYPGHVASWNLRSNSFMGTIDWAMKRIANLRAIHDIPETVPPAKIVVWAHNSHVGDMSTTGYSSQSQMSIGQLCRETFGTDSVFSIGMTTYEGTVRAAFADKSGSCWQGKGDVQSLSTAVEDSHEFVLHSLCSAQGVHAEKTFGLSLRNISQNNTMLTSRNERFVGSCYLKNSEITSHYTKCDLIHQFDYLVHVDNSSAICL